MKLNPFPYFNFAGPNDFVAFTRAGREIVTGRGLAGFLRPSTSVVVVPLGVKTVNYVVTERSSDGQQITISGEVVVVNTAEMREYFDFSVFPQNGMFRKDPTTQIEDQVRIAVRAPLRAKLAGMSVEEISSGVAEIGEMLAAEVQSDNSKLMQQLARYAIKVESISVESADPEDDELSESIGAEEREDFLAAADDAVADRRLRAAEKERTVRTYEEETTLELTRKQAERIEEEGKNKIAEATADASAVQKQLEPFSDMEPGVLLAHALMKASERGLRSVSIDPGLLAAIKGVQKEE